MMIATTPRGFEPGSRLYRPPQHFFRGSLGRFATGVAIVTFDVGSKATAGPDVEVSQSETLPSVAPPVEPLPSATLPVDTRRGITVNSFTSVSLEPPLVLVSIARIAKAHDELVGRPFTVNVLGAEQEALASHFAGRPALAGPVATPIWVEGELAPRLGGVLSYFECAPWAAYDGGDHTLYLGEVKHYDYRSGDALGFVNGRFTAIPEYLPGHEDLL